LQLFHEEILERYGSILEQQRLIGKLPKILSHPHLAAEVDQLNSLLLMESNTLQEKHQIIAKVTSTPLQFFFFSFFFH
jgi:hypothetical protein